MVFDFFRASIYCGGGGGEGCNDLAFSLLVRYFKILYDNVVWSRKLLDRFTIEKYNKLRKYISKYRVICLNI